MEKIKAFFDGKKTYLSAIACGLVMVAFKLGLIDIGTTEWLLSLFGVATAVFLRAGIEKRNNP